MGKQRRSLRRLSTVLLACLAPGLSACGGGSADETSNLSSLVVDNYTALVKANYTDTLESAEALRVAIDEFVADPSEQGHRAAREAWLAARESYGQTEAFRAYAGPIDAVEGWVNSWPLDEAFIDYVEGDDEAGIINRPDDFPELTPEALAELNVSQGEDSISTGYHAIEFLLWGQDLSADGPGERPYTDYVAGGTHQNQERRADYLRAVAALLVEHLQSVDDAWAPNSDDYRAEFLGLDPKVALGKMLKGMGSLSGAELSGERMLAAYKNKGQEDEHSCFSDNTPRDLHNNALSVQNVYLGRYAELDGPGIDELVRAKDPALDRTLQQQLELSLTLVDAIPQPFDQAILGSDDAPGRQALLAAIRALQAETETLQDVARALGIPVALDE